MKCLIVDDETAAIQLLEGYLQNVSTLVHCESFFNPIEALRYTWNNKVDLIFLDINMPHLSGIGFLELLGSETKVILTSAYFEYALDGYKYDVVDYLVKPVSFESFLRAVKKAEDRRDPGGELKKPVVTGELDDFVMLKSEGKGKWAKVLFSDIVYVESMRNYIAIYTRQKDRIMTLLSLKELEERLPKDYFFRTHKTFIVALSQIKMIDGGEIILQDVKDRIPLGATYRQAFFDRLEAKIVKPKGLDGEELMDK
ncbi:MAG: response regulator transcription factor [Leadbetterella sp.]|nr:response regulator transcription factor [Leadbetterella sp.]